MGDYIRAYRPGGTFFFTLVTNRRRLFLTGALARGCLREAIRKVRISAPFQVVAVVLLPDHLHTIWTLPPGDCDYSGRWKAIKAAFTEAFLAAGGTEGPRTPGQVRKGERGVWQSRFWEHMVRDDGDMKRCADYVHWNPVKHGLVSRVRDYPW